MGSKTRPRKGSLQYYPRKRAKKMLPRISWDYIKEDKELLGFIGYKVGMKTAYAKDNTPDSLTKGKRITFPVTIIECPPMKILSVRFYKNKKVIGEVLNSNLDKELKKKIKLPKKKSKKIEDFKDYGDVSVVVYSQVKKTSIKKTPDVVEMPVRGNNLEFIKNNLSKEISIRDVINGGLIDIRGVTKGYGTQGPTKRFGLTLRGHKSEKGRRGPGSMGPWHPARVQFATPMAGQTGFFVRVKYNNKIILCSNVSENNINPKEGFKKYGKIKGDYLIIYGSVQGPAKRQLLLTYPQRASKNQNKKNYEFIELR